MDKQRILEALRAKMAQELAVIRASAAAAREGATHEDAKPENEYDTRGLEQSYLAGAQAARADALASAIDALGVLPLAPLPPHSAVAVGACVVVEDAEEARRYFLCPVGGGTKLEVDGQTWRVLSPESPLGRALVGRFVGDVVQHRTRGDAAELEIIETC